jgi:hypothetical protein
MKMYRRVEVKFHTLLISIPDQGEWSYLHSSCFISNILWIGGWVCPKAGLDVKKRKTPDPARV